MVIKVASSSSDSFKEKIYRYIFFSFPYFIPIVPVMTTKESPSKKRKRDGKDHHTEHAALLVQAKILYDEYEKLKHACEAKCVKPEEDVVTLQSYIRALKFELASSRDIITDSIRLGRDMQAQANAISTTPSSLVPSSSSSSSSSSLHAKQRYEAPAELIELQAKYYRDFKPAIEARLAKETKAEEPGVIVFLGGAQWDHHEYYLAPSSTITTGVEAALVNPNNFETNQIAIEKALGSWIKLEPYVMHQVRANRVIFSPTFA